MAPAAERPADWLTRLIERSANPFLLREWRRSQRGSGGPLAAPMAFCAFAGACVVLSLLLFLLLLHPKIAASMGPMAVTASSLGRWLGGVGTFLVGGGAWVLLFIAYWLASAQVFEEEKQNSLELLLTIPQSRGRLVLALTAWPFLRMATMILPLLPIVAFLMPILGLDPSLGVRLVLVVAAICLLVCLRAPSGRALQGAGSRGGPGEALAVVAGGLVVLPLLAWAADRFLGVPRLGVLQWPFGLAELLVQRRPWWGGDTHLGAWLGGLWALLAVGRWLHGWARLSEGTDYRPVAAAAAWTPGALLAAYFVAGLAWPQMPPGERETHLWSGLCLLFAALLAAVATRGGTGLWFLWPATRPGRVGLPRAALRLADAGLVALAPALLWRLGTGQRWGSLPPGAFDELAALLAVGAVAAAFGEWSARQLDGAELAGERASARVRSAAGWCTLLWIAGAAACCRQTWDPVFGWTGVLLGWDPRVAFGVLLAGSSGCLGPALYARFRHRSAGGGAEEPVGPSLLWRLLPRAWRENPLAIKAHRRMRRQGLTSLLLWVNALVGLLGLLPACLSWLDSHLPDRPTGLLGYLMALFMTAWQQMGTWLGTAVFGVPSLPAGAASMLAVICVSGLVVALVLFLASATLAGRMVTEERIAGSLGFLLMSSMSDREVAEGFLIGHLFPVLEATVTFVVVLFVWSLVGFHWTVSLAGGLMALFAVGLVLLTSGLAFLGTARYESRANGTPVAVFGVLSLQVCRLACVRDAGVGILCQRHAAARLAGARRCVVVGGYAAGRASDVALGRRRDCLAAPPGPVVARLRAGFGAAIDG